VDGVFFPLGKKRRRRTRTSKSPRERKGKKRGEPIFYGISTFTRSKRRKGEISVLIPLRREGGKKRGKVIPSSHKKFRVTYTKKVAGEEEQQQRRESRDIFFAVHEERGSLPPLDFDGEKKKRKENDETLNYLKTRTKVKGTIRDCQKQKRGPFSPMKKGGGKKEKGINTPGVLCIKTSRF